MRRFEIRHADLLVAEGVQYSTGAVSALLRDLGVITSFDLYPLVMAALAAVPGYDADLLELTWLDRDLSELPPGDIEQPTGKHAENRIQDEAERLDVLLQGETDDPPAVFEQ